MAYEIRDWKRVFQNIFRTYPGLNNVNYVFVNRELCSKGLIRIGRDGPSGESEEFCILKQNVSVEHLRNIPEFSPVDLENVFHNCPPALPRPGKTIINITKSSLF